MIKLFVSLLFCLHLSPLSWSQGGVDSLVDAFAAVDRLRVDSDSVGCVSADGGIVAPVVLAVKPAKPGKKHRQPTCFSVDESTRFRPQKLIAPGVLIVVGTLGVATNWLDPINYAVRDKMAEWRGDRYVRVDDYLQYVPLVANFGMSLLGAKARHGYLDRVLITATSYLALAAMVNGVKYTVKEERPDGSARNSFPSGHTATAFMGAELVRIEYGHASPLYGIGAYAVACSVGILRIYNERHWCTDVLAGAGIGILSARIGYWMLPVNRRLFGLDKKRKSKALVVAPSYNAYYGTYGGAVALRF